jgi:hypothetical protein
VCQWGSIFTSALTPFQREVKTTKARLEKRASGEFSSWHAAGQALLRLSRIHDTMQKAALKKVSGTLEALKDMANN